MGKRRWQGVCALILLGNFILGCSMRAPYMRHWRPTPGLNYRWTGGAVNESRLSNDEAAVYAAFGKPEVIRFFRALHTRQRVYEWIYEEQDRIVWFVDGKRVAYVAVDANSSALSKETREAVQRKLVSGAVLGTVVGGFASGFLLLGDGLGLKN